MSEMLSERIGVFGNFLEPLCAKREERGVYEEGGGRRGIERGEGGKGGGGRWEDQSSYLSVRSHHYS